MPPMQGICPAHLLVCQEYELQLSQLAQAEKFLNFLGEVPSLITAGPLSVLTKVFSGYSLSRQVNVGNLLSSKCWEPHLGYDSFLLLPFLHIIHKSPCHLLLYFQIMTVSNPHATSQYMFH